MKISVITRFVIPSVAVSLALTSSSRADITSYSLTMSENQLQTLTSDGSTLYSNNMTASGGTGQILSNQSYGYDSTGNPLGFTLATVTNGNVTATTNLLQVGLDVSKPSVQVASDTFNGPNGETASANAEGEFTATFTLNSAGTLYINSNSFGLSSQGSIYDSLDGTMLNALSGAYTNTLNLSAGTHTLVFEALTTSTPATNGGQVVNDFGFSVNSAAVPEPATFVFIGLGTVGILAKRRRR